MIELVKEDRKNIEYFMIKCALELDKIIKQPVSKMQAMRVKAVS